LGSVPAHWETKPLKHIANFINGEAFKPTEWDDDGTPIIRIQNLNGGTDFNYFRGFVEPRYHVSKGDLLFGWSGNRGTSFGPFRWSIEGLHYLNQHIFRVEEYACNRDWLYWCLKAVTVNVEHEAHGIIGMVHITKGRLGSIIVPTVSTAEQEAIAAFLDRETAKIDALVEEQWRLILLLKEKRQAVISHAVTKGLDPSAPMKDSGIEWLGEVPAHWDVAALKRFCVKITDGAHISPETDGGSRPFVSTKDISEAGIDFDECLLTSESSYEYLVRTGCQPVDGDVLFSKDGTIGRTVVVRGARDFVVASSLIIIRPNHKELDSDFFHYLCQSVSISSQVGGFVKGAGLPRLSIQNLLRVVGVFPPLREQVAIARHLTGIVGQFSALVDQAESGIALLQERRAALISAVVTGKIDVRGLANVREEAP
jgi:type I restriction enzyme S subunit